MTRFFQFSFLSIILLCLFTQANAQISGTVFRDYNANGVRGTAVPNLEPGVNGIIVTAYDTANAILSSYTTNAAGAYSIPATGTYNGILGSNTGSVASGVAVRLEFTIPASGTCANENYDFSSFSGSGNGTSEQFVSGGATNVNYEINDPADYSSTTNPEVVVPQHSNGNPLLAGTSQSQNWFNGFPYNNSGTTAPAKVLNGSTIGSVWGVAYSKQAKKIFTSAFIKRHAGLGVLGSGGIYVNTSRFILYSI